VRFKHAHQFVVHVSIPAEYARASGARPVGRSFTMPFSRSATSCAAAGAVADTSNRHNPTVHPNASGWSVAGEEETRIGQHAGRWIQTRTASARSFLHRKVV
jgi:hypothetical protein